MRRMRTGTIAAISAALALITAAELGAQTTETFRQYQFAAGVNGHDLVPHELPRPDVGADEILVRVRATSLNRRDLYILNSQSGQRGNLAGSVPLSDGAGEVISPYLLANMTTLDPTGRLITATNFVIAFGQALGPLVVGFMLVESVSGQVTDYSPALTMGLVALTICCLLFVPVVRANNRLLSATN